MTSMKRAFLISCLLVTLPVSAQQTLIFHDGTTEFTSRGALGVNAKSVLQRLPGDQICGLVNLVDAVSVIQDQTVATAEAGVIFEVRANDPAVPVGAPDMTPAGLIAAVPIPPIAFPPPGPVAALVITVVFPAPGVPLPPGPIGSPGSDIYLGWAFPPQPLWPGDGISCHISAALGGNAGEQFRAGAVGYGGVAGAAALGWDVDLTLAIVALATGNRSWLVQADFSENTLQPFADNAAVFVGGPTAPAGPGAGLNPNFGYAGIWPDLVRGDGIGLYVQSPHVVGSSVIFLLSPVLAPAPLAIPGIIGSLCVPLPPLSTLIPPAPPFFATVAPPVGAPWVSEFTLGPIFGLAALAGVGDLFVQVVTIDAGTGVVMFSNVARANL